ncbi:fas-binding factor 1 [Labeo rohita]|uniref:Fas-binding factor 1 n=1 Tax=Labeo rohita TaxID=84645 RepID=A0A498P0Z2_LABRO|nr:fas-binding factor 1 [Labeo rohita]
MVKQTGVTSRQKKGLRSSIDDVLGDLLGDDDDEGPVKVRSPAALTSRSGKRSLLDDDFFSKLAEEAEKDDEKSKSDPPLRARTRLDEILGRGTSPRLLERPTTGEKKDTPHPEKQMEKPPEKSSAGKASLMDEEDFTFGSYQPTMGSTPEGRQSRRQSVRFSTEDVSIHSPEHKPKPSTRAARPRSDWLGLKQDEEEQKMKEEPKQSAPETLKPPASPSTGARKETPSLKTASADPPAAPSSPKTISKPVKRDEDEEDDWLAGALSRKKTQPVSQSEERETKQEVSSSLGEEVDVFVSSKSNVPSATRRRQDEPPVLNTEPRARVKLLEESAAQRELRSRQENEDLAERLAAVTRLAEQERAEMQAQQQRRLAQCQQDRDREVERLRDLQRKSILEMKRDHEEQIQRLKKLKDEEIDAVTSATSQTRSLTVVIEQMEQFSRRLGDLSSRVESSHENTAQGLEIGARQRDEQLRVLQDRLSQQQREMAEERSRLKEVIAKMDTQLAEQQRQLEKERWRVTSEQAKAESSLRGLEEERRTMMQQFGMEREELERAKSALLEEQQSVMQHCAEERRKLAAEWSRFHTQEKLRQERIEREASRALERDANREGSIISMAQDQADLKLRAGELKQKEEALMRERDCLEKLKQELDTEKDRLSAAALRLKTRAQEVESFSKLASERFEEGERALREARQVEAEHQTRLRNIHTQMERLRQQEHNLQQERLRMTDHHRDMERLRHTLPVHPGTSAPLITDFSPALASTHLSAVVNPQPAELHARLALIKHTAEKDRDFLQEEQYFLDTLKKTSYNSSLNT